jgi:hypothetical protein
MGAAAGAALAVYCMFAVGKDDLVNFIYFQF